MSINVSLLIIEKPTINWINSRGQNKQPVRIEQVDKARFTPIESVYNILDVGHSSVVYQKNKSKLTDY